MDRPRSAADAKGGSPIRPTDHTSFGTRFADALRAATLAHQAQIRKGTHLTPDGSPTEPVPYISHPLGVCSIALGYGATEDEAIGALLHDLIEDTHPTETARATVAGFGPDVLAIVEDCTDGEPGEDGEKEPTEVRKARYLEGIARHGRSSLLVSASDKLHNARSVVADLRTHGDGVWSRFNLGREGQLAHYGKLVDAFVGNPAHHPELVAELDRTVAEMYRLSGVAYARRTTDRGGS